MKVIISRLLAVCVVVAAFTNVGLFFWYVFGNLPNPLPQHLADLVGLGAMSWWMLGLASYIFTCSAVALMFLASSRIVLLGWAGFWAEEKEKSVEAKKAAVSTVGTLVAVSDVTVGLFDSATTLIETSEGYFQVFGTIDSAQKGAQVTIQREFRIIFTIEWLCFAGKKYQLCK